VDPSCNETGYQPDHFLVPCNQLRSIINIKHKFDGAPSNHCALFLTYHLGNEKTFPTKLKNKVIKKIMKIDNDCLRTSGNSTFKEKVTEFLNFLNESEENKQLP